MIDIEFFIPYYGSADYLIAAVSSIRQLEDTRWRLTIVDDNYPGGSATQRRIEELGDNRIRYLRNETNLGPNANTYRCIQLAEWERFVVIGHDDLVSSDYGRKIATLLSRYPDAAVVQPQVQVIDEAGQPCFPLADRVKSWLGPGSQRAALLRGEPGVASLLHGNWLYSPACCYKRTALQRIPFRAEIDAAHDLAFLVDVLMNGETIIVGTEAAFQYRRHQTSHSSSFARSGKRFEHEHRYFADIAEVCRSLGWKRAERAASMHLTSRLNAASQALQALGSGDIAAVRMLLRHAIGSGTRSRR